MRSYAAFAAVLALGASSPGNAQTPGLAVADASRPASDRDKDAARHPADLIGFAGIGPGSLVMDVWPGGGYWTRLFSDVVGASGHVFAYVPSEIASSPADPVAKIRAVAAEPGRSNVSVASDPLAQPPPADFRNKLDLIWTFENYHDLHDSFMHGADVRAFLHGAFLMLKPGGAFIVADHTAASGSGLSATETLHRIDPASVRAEAAAAGFVFDGALNVLANPADPHTAKVFDPAVRGQTDRFVYRFRKPL